MSTSTATKSQTATVNGVELGYEIHGEGAPVVLLHGGFGTLDMFGPNLELLARDFQVIGVDLQSHGRSPAANRPMRFETMGDDIAALIRELGHAKASLIGFSLGGGVCLRTAIQHPDVVERAVLVSTPFTSDGWYPEMRAGMRAMGPETAEFLRQTPMFAGYAAVAPNIDDWTLLVTQVADLLHQDYDWSADIGTIKVPLQLVIGDADGLPPSHAVEFFGLLGGGKRDAKWDRSGMTQHRLAILPGVTHYDINVSPLLPIAVTPFLRGE
jgi:pimeloyl-ACP methyl ester carboxylesterase